MTAPLQETRPVFFTLLMPWGRVGSNLVAHAFGGVKGIKVANEPTTAMRTAGHKARKPVAQINQEQFAHLSAFTEKTPLNSVGAGLKLSHRSLVDHEAYLGRLQDLGYRLILMVRGNHLKCAVSQIRALQRASAKQTSRLVWRSPWAIGAHEEKPGASEIDIDEVLRLTKLFARLESNMMKSVAATYGSEYLKIEYNNLHSDPHATIQSAFDYLGILAPDPIPINFRKATSNDLSDDIINFEAFRNSVEAAGYAHFL